ncbi:MAG: hypothetical protein ACREP0_06960 [Rhodanobacteraceae bacterium]
MSHAKSLSFSARLPEKAVSLALLATYFPCGVGARLARDPAMSWMTPRSPEKKKQALRAGARPDRPPGRRAKKAGMSMPTLVAQRAETVTACA